MYNTILVLVMSKVFGIIKDQAPARILPDPFLVKLRDNVNMGIQVRTDCDYHI